MQMFQNLSLKRKTLKRLSNTTTTSIKDKDLRNFKRVIFTLYSLFLIKKNTTHFNRL